MGDRVQLQQVLLNLIMNACEAMSDTDSRDRSLAVSTARDGDSNLRLTVADRGPGISSDLGDRIFEPFVTTKAQGLGLGLSICRSIVAAHGGQLWVANNPDRQHLRVVADPRGRPRIGDEASSPLPPCRGRSRLTGNWWAPWARTSAPPCRPIV